jgi:hypothetical protein
MFKTITLADGSKGTVRVDVDLAYVIQGDDPGGVVKVGRSRSPERRVAGLMSGIPFSARLIAIVGSGVRREREMKALLAEQKLRGEWFAPSEKLNAYLQTVREENGLFSKVQTNEAFFTSYIQPAVLEYLNGRQPNHTSAGDYVFRVLHCGYPAIAGRAATLIEACPNALSPELIAGYVPLGVDEPTPQVRLVPAPAETVAA